MSNFGKIHHKDGSYLTNDIHLDCAETIKVFGEDNTVMGLRSQFPARKHESVMNGEGGITNWLVSCGISSKRVKVPSPCVHAGGVT